MVAVSLKCFVCKNDFMSSHYVGVRAKYCSKECLKKRIRIRNKVKDSEYRKRYYLEHDSKGHEKRRVFKNIEEAKEYRLAWLAIYTRERKRKDIEFKIRCNLRTRLNAALKNVQKRGSAIKDLGCSVRELKQYIETQFLPGMTWENWSIHGWHIDHKIPLAIFNLSDREELLKAVHFSNLQPLWADENWRKGDKLLEVN